MDEKVQDVVETASKAPFNKKAALISFAVTTTVIAVAGVVVNRMKANREESVDSETETA